MNDAAIKNFCIDARRTLLEEVAQRLAWWGIEEGHDGRPQSRAQGAQLDGRVLSADEQRQCTELLRMAGNDRKSMDALIERGAYTWFNRLVAIRYMELNGRLPGRVRMLSADDGSFEPQCLRKALDMRLTGLDQARVLELRQSGDDEGLFRYLLLLQCDELARCMPVVFEPIGAAMELLLPGQLLRSGSVLDRLVTQIPEDDWREGVQIVGWMYQYYISERKDEVFASFKKGKKAERDAIAPATQLFTPDWIVQYLLQNSLGRLWMLARPESNLASKMPYYISPEGETETPRTLTSPEELRVCDPACGSGHMLVYAFELLMEVYLESGFTARDAVQLIVEQNLQGMEIDERATALASFAVTMKACEYDSRFLRRGVTPQVTCLRAVPFTDEELELLPHVKAERGLSDVLAHLDECGSLYAPTSEQIAALESDAETLNHGLRLSTADLPSKLALALEQCGLLSKTFDVVVANPPYMGGSSLDKWESAWVKKTYPNSKADLCTCFIERGFSLSNVQGYNAMVTMQSWMFLGSFEKMRSSLLNRHSIVNMAHLGTRAFSAIGGEVVSVTATSFANQHSESNGGYLRLVDFGSEHEKEHALRVAITNPNCGWFYRRKPDTFKVIPGTPIAYWASEALLNAFLNGVMLRNYVEMPYGFKTGDNDRFLRLWWECKQSNSAYHTTDDAESVESRKKWFSYNKGGQFRKWYGNNDYVFNYEDGGREVLGCAKSDGRSAADYNHSLLFAPVVTWSRISTGLLNMRFNECGSVCDMTGCGFYGNSNTLSYLQAYCNSSVVALVASILSPTLDFQPGQIGSYPVLGVDEHNEKVITSVGQLRDLSRSDWDSFETSWDFRRSPLV